MKEETITKQCENNLHAKQDEKQQQTERWFIVIVMLCWTWLNFWVAWRYEPRRDVAQSWMIVRQLDLAGVFAQLKYEGHPCLWYMLLMPLAKLGLPYLTIIVVSFVLTGLGIWLFLRYAPVGKLAKLAVVFCVAGMYYLPVVARSYALIPLLLMLLWLAYPKRYTRPVRYAILLFMLCQVHVLLCGLVGALMLLWFIGMPKAIAEHKAKPVALIGSLITMIGAVLFLYWQLAGSVGANEQVTFSYYANIMALRNLFIKVINEGSLALIQIRPLEIGNHFWWLFLVPFFLCGLALGIIWFWRAPRSAFVTLCMVGWQLSVHALVYSPHLFHMITFVWMLIFCVLLAITELQSKTRCMARLDALLKKALISTIVVISILSCVQVYPAILLECSDKGVTSYGKATAQYINEQLPENALVLIADEDFAPSVAAFCADGKFYNPIRHNDHIFSLHDSQSKSWCYVGDLDAEITALRLAGRDNPLYLLTSEAGEAGAAAMSDRSAAKLVWIQRFANDFALENYALYRIEESGTPVIDQ